MNPKNSQEIYQTLIQRLNIELIEIIYASHSELDPDSIVTKQSIWSQIGQKSTCVSARVWLKSNYLKVWSDQWRSQFH